MISFDMIFTVNKRRTTVATSVSVFTFSGGRKQNVPLRETWQEKKTYVCHNETSKNVDSWVREETSGSIHMWGKFCCHCAKLPAISPAWLSRRQMALWGVTRVHSRVAFASTSSSQSETSLSERTFLQSGRDRGQRGNFSSHQVCFFSYSNKMLKRFTCMAYPPACCWCDEWVLYLELPGVLQTSSSKLCNNLMARRRSGGVGLWGSMSPLFYFPSFFFFFTQGEPPSSIPPYPEL